MPVSIDVQAGRKAYISLQPAFNPTSSVDLGNLSTFLANCKANGVQADVALWPRPSAQGLTATQYQAMIAYYGPTVQSFYPLVYHGLADATTAGSAATFTSYYPGSAACDKVAVTYTAAAYEAGVTLDAYAAVADTAAGGAKPFGIGSFEANSTTDTSANITAFFSYVQTFMANRVTSGGRVNGDAVWYNETPTASSTFGTIGTADFQVPLYQSLFDVLTGQGTPPVTVGLQATLNVTAARAAAAAVTSGPVTVSVQARLAVTAAAAAAAAGGAPQPAPSGDGGGTAPRSVFPTLTAEAGFAAPAPYPPPGTLLIGDPAAGIVGTGVLGAAATWTDLSAFLRSGAVSRGSTRQQGPTVTYDAGTVSAVLKNGDGRFDPSNLNGPYVAGGVPLIRPMVPIRVRATWGGTTYFLFTGYTDSWQSPDTNWGPHYSETTLSATDGFKVLSGIVRAGQAALTGAGEDSGARINRILDGAGWSPSDRLISTGDTQLQGTYLAGDPLSEMQLAADTELADLYVNGEGRVVFRHRQAIAEDTRSAVVQAVFGDAPGNPVDSAVVVASADVYVAPYFDAYGGGGNVSGSSGVYNGSYDTVYPAGGTGAATFTGFTELPYAGMGRADDDTQLVNDVQITRAIVDTNDQTVPVMQEYTDQSSVAQFLFPRSYSRTDLIMTSDTEANAYARYIVNLAKGGENRCDTLTIQPLRDPANLFPQVLGREIGDRIQIWRRPPGVTAPVVKDCFIRGISHTFDASSATWETQWQLQDATRFQFFVVGDNALGVLGRYPLGY